MSWRLPGSMRFELSLSTRCVARYLPSDQISRSSPASWVLRMYDIAWTMPLSCRAMLVSRVVSELCGIAALSLHDASDSTMIVLGSRSALLPS